MNLQRGYNTARTYRQIFKLPIRVKPVCWPQTSKPAEIPIILFLNGCQNVNEAEGQWVNVCPLSLHPFISLKRISMLHTDEDVSFKQLLWWVTRESWSFLLPPESKTESWSSAGSARSLSVTHGLDSGCLWWCPLNDIWGKELIMQLDQWFCEGWLSSGAHQQGGEVGE